MDDLISRQALMKEFSDFVRKSNNSDFAPTPTWNDAVSLVESMPSAERRGRWIGLDSDEEKYDEIRCSACGRNYTVDAYRWCDIGFTVEDLKYCPNCGAKMDEVEE